MARGNNNKNNHTPAKPPTKTITELQQQVQLKEQQKQQQKQQKEQQQQQQQQQKHNGSLTKDEEIASLRQQLQAMEARMQAVEAQVAITSKVNSLLSIEIDRLEQYGRRNSVVIRGILPKDSETNEDLKQSVKTVVGELGMKEQFNRDFDKTHRIGPVLDTPQGKRQDVIVRFKSHSTRYEVYRKRKELKNKSVRITPSLTKKRRKLLSTARSEYDGHEDVNFIYVN